MTIKHISKKHKSLITFILINKKKERFLHNGSILYA